MQPYSHYPSGNPGNPGNPHISSQGPSQSYTNYSYANVNPMISTAKAVNSMGSGIPSSSFTQSTTHTTYTTRIPAIAHPIANFPLSQPQPFVRHGGVSRTYTTLSAIPTESGELQMFSVAKTRDNQEN